MSERIALSDETLDNITGGTMTFDWDGHNGNIGLNGDKSYHFTDRSAMIAFATQCYQQGKSDEECIQGMLSAGIIW